VGEPNGLESLERRALLATINASAVISSTPAGPDFSYTIKLSNPSSSTAPIGTFWYAWFPGEDFLATRPISVKSPTGWTGNITNAGPGDGFAIQFVADNSVYDVQPGGSLSFSFTSADSPASIAGDSVFYPGTPVGTAFVYQQGPFMGASDQFVVTPAPTTPTPTPSADFVIGADNQVYTRPLDASGNPTGGYHQVAFGQVKDLAVTRLAGSTSFEDFVIGGDNQVYASTISGSTHGGYFATASGSVASISVGTDAHGNPLLFAVGTDHQLYEQTFNASGKATSPSYTKAAIGDFNSTTLTHDAQGNPLLYAIGQDDQVYGLKLTASGLPSGGLFKVAPGGVNQLAVASTASGDPELFVIGLDGFVYALKTDATGSPISGYTSVGGPAKSITVGADAGGDPLVFAIGTDGQVYGHQFDATGTPTGTFYGTAAGSANSIVAGVGSGGDPEVFAVLSKDGSVYTEPLGPTGKSTGPFTLTTAGAVKKVVVV
jgi:hypothetical protein